MPANGAQQRAQSDGCSYPHVFPQPGNKPCTAERHGATVGYRTTYGCTCPAAVAAAYRWHKAARFRKARGQRLRIDATGTRRRIQALVANGWTLEDLGGRLGGITASAVSRMARDPRVLTSSATRVARVYDELADYPGPSQKSARRARTRGWLPPLWWDDDTIDDPDHHPARREQLTKHDIDPVAVDRACAGYPIRLTIAERHTAVARLAARGQNNSQIAELLHTTSDAIQQIQLRHLRHTSSDVNQEATG